MGRFRAPVDNRIAILTPPPDGRWTTADTFGATDMRLMVIVGALVTFAWCYTLPTVAADPFVKVLTSARQNVGVESWQADARELTGGKSDGAWTVRKIRLHGGKQEGVDVIIVDNGKLQVAVCPTRGMGLLWATLGDVRLGWDSPVKETVDPRFVNLQERGGLGWLTGFNEFACRCGLEWSGHPGTDKFINNVGDEATMELTLHGKVANLPASEVEVVIEREAPYRIH